ncbi:MAG: TatD family hydrolase, partial [Bacteroidales bacterium]|nr:TatD family hydrolase [Bacteroidales bacterium]
MQLIDSHTHLYLPEFDNDRDEVIKRALNSGVIKMLLPNIDRESIKPMMQMARDYPGICLPMIGVHPTSIKDDYLEHLEAVEEN